jgi:hypothetical protein
MDQEEPIVIERGDKPTAGAVLTGCGEETSLTARELIDIEQTMDIVTNK